jgi:hypothetical protein
MPSPPSARKHAKKQKLEILLSFPQVILIINAEDKDLKNKFPRKVL